ncbi:hypothetical protein [Thioclava sp. JM3]|uniref:hypothetical protein n=1 Tax=Thioclava sp. JM3 TaxID=1973004 RepID=UPI00117CE180|nr:hypothetical protein [Thioclava sp. JM3]
MFFYLLPASAQAALISYQTSRLSEKILLIVEATSAVIALPALAQGVLPLIEAFRGNGIGSMQRSDYVGVFLTLAPTSLFLVIYIARKRWRDGILYRFSSQNLLTGRPGKTLREEMVDASSGRIDDFAPEFGWTDPKLNAWIAKQSFTGAVLKYEIEGSYYSYRPTDGSENKAQQLRTFALNAKMKQNVKIFNGMKVRMAGDLFPGRTNAIPLQKTDYVSSLMSDQLAFHRIADENSGQVLSDGISSFLEHMNGDSGQKIYRLKSLSQADVSNQIGVSTIAFTKDGMIPFVVQTNKNAQSHGKLAPSGSGSLDWSDIYESSVNHDFWSLIRYGAARELLEECGIGQRLDVEEFSRENVRIYAFARMIHRGGKPEFFAIALLPYTMRQLSEMKVFGSERAYSIRTRASDGPPIEAGTDIRASIIQTCEFYSDERNIHKIMQGAIALSYPLHHGLELLVEAAKDRQIGVEIADFVKANLLAR